MGEHESHDSFVILFLKEISILNLPFRRWFLPRVPGVNCIILDAKSSLEKKKKNECCKQREDGSASHSCLQLISSFMHAIFTKQSNFLAWSET